MAAAGTVGASAIIDRNELESNQDFHEEIKIEQLLGMPLWIVKS